MRPAPNLANPSTPPAPGPRARTFVAAVYALDGDLRYLSHHDELRMLARALVRADWPVAYSEGFNPQPRIALPLPRAVGLASQAQWAVIELAEPRPVESLRAALAAALPAGPGPSRALRLLRVLPELPHRRLHAVQVDYQVDLDPQDAERVAPRLDRLLASDSVRVQRTFGPGKPPREVDIRPFLRELALQAPQSASERALRLRMRLAFDGQRTARPGEVLAALHLPAETYAHRICRTAVDWAEPLTLAVAEPPCPERNE